MYRFVHCIIFLASVLSTVHSALINECPHPEDCYPCYCEEDDERTTLHCNYLSETQQFRNALKHLTRHKIDTLSIWMYQEENITSDAFKGPIVKDITFSHSRVVIEAPPFAGHEKTLSRITFLSCFDEKTAIGSWELGHLENLKEVSLEKNQIKVLENNWLVSSGPVLRSVTFDNCQIEELDDKVFSRLDKATTIFLMDNKIKTLSRSMFPKPAENLRSINLNGNEISSLPDGIFTDMPSLTTVELERNQLSTLSESVWSKKLDDLIKVYLEGNMFVCDKSMKWISKKSLPKTFTGKCNLPEKLKNMKLKHLTPADFH